MELLTKANSQIFRKFVSLLLNSAVLEVNWVESSYTITTGRSYKSGILLLVKALVKHLPAHQEAQIAQNCGFPWAQLIMLFSRWAHSRPAVCSCHASFRLHTCCSLCHLSAKTPSSQIFHFLQGPDQVSSPLRRSP